MALRIAIDAGHGLTTAGKEVPSYMGYGKIKEWTLNDKVTREMIRLLGEYEGVEVLRVDDPTGRTDVELEDRCEKANKFKADIFISNHHNAGIGGGKGGGLVVFRYPNSSKFTKDMQQALYNSILQQTGLKGNRAEPLSEAKFYVLKYTNMAAVLIEHGFMDSPADMKEIMKPYFATKSALGVVSWLAQHYKLQKKEAEGSEFMEFRTLKHGMTGQDVGLFQRILKLLGYYTGPIDDSFGPGQGFLTAVKNFQAAEGLEVDGNIGPKTRARIFERLMTFKAPEDKTQINQLQDQLTKANLQIKTLQGELAEFEEFFKLQNKIIRKVVG